MGDKNISEDDGAGRLTASGKNGLPIFFVQLGTHTNLFLDKILRQACQSNGKENVFVLADTNFHLYTQFNCIDVTKYTSLQNKFDDVYRHHSTNSVAFEKACFDRWFIINELVKEYHIPYFVHADCDVMIYQDLKPVYQNLLKRRYDGSVMFYQSGENSVTSGHTSFWSNALIDQFCEFTVAKFNDPIAFEELLEDTLSGKFLDNKNVSDMILLDVFRTEIKPNTLNLTSLEEQNIFFDFNANVAYNGWKHHYRLNRKTGIKKVIKRPDGFYVPVEDTTRQMMEVKVYTLHFQGYLTKTLIPLHTLEPVTLTKINNYFSGKYAYFSRRFVMLKNKLKAIVKNSPKK